MLRILLCEYSHNDWLARLGKERIDEVFDPSLAMQR